MLLVNDVVKLSKATNKVLKMQEAFTLKELYEIIKVLSQEHLSILPIREIPKHCLFTFEKQLTGIELSLLTNREWLTKWLMSLNKATLSDLGDIKKISPKSEIVQFILTNKICLKRALCLFVKRNIVYITKSKTCRVMPLGNYYFILNIQYDANVNNYWTLSFKEASGDHLEIEIDISKLNKISFCSYVSKFLNKKNRYQVKIESGVSLNINQDIPKVSLDFRSLKSIQKSFGCRKILKHNKLKYIQSICNNYSNKKKIEELLEKKIIISNKKIMSNKLLNTKEFLGLFAYLVVEYIKDDFYICKVSKNRNYDLINALYATKKELNYYVAIM